MDACASQLDGTRGGSSKSQAPSPKEAPNPNVEKLMDARISGGVVAPKAFGATTRQMEWTRAPLNSTARAAEAPNPKLQVPKKFQIPMSKSSWTRAFLEAL